MRKTVLPFSQVPQLSKSDTAYATGDPRLTPFWEAFPSAEAFTRSLEIKKQSHFPRKDLVETLRRQYRPLTVKERTEANIEALSEENTFTIVTAHQPSLLLGPMYFVYKALTTIQLAQTVQAENPGCKIVPVFVLGSEDHDLDELNKINLYGKQLVWEPGETGAVGSMSAASLAPVLGELKGVLGENEAATALFDRVNACCSSAETQAAATQALLHEFFGDQGLVVIDMNDAVLKRHFLPVIKAELTEQPAFRLVNETITALQELGFKAQAAPREINLFYLRPGMRERIVREAGIYKVLNTDISFTEEAMLAEAEAHPEHFSPNVILRPLYQEMILPNLAYVGGGGELAYWLERKSLFAHYGMRLPILVRRHSILWLDKDAVKKLGKLGFDASRLFEDTDSLVREFVARNAEVEVNLEPEIEALKQIFQQIAQKAAAVDPTLEKAVLADSVKAAGNLEQWQSRLLRTEKQKHDTLIQQLRQLKEKLFPGGSLQERHDNFLAYVLKYGDAFFERLLENMAPYEQGFVIFEEV